MIQISGILEDLEVAAVIDEAAGPCVHVHVVLGLSDGTTGGGHLLKGRVFPTLEVIIREAPAELRKVMNPRYRDRAHRSRPVGVVTCR
jgi:uncharacterized protein